MNNIEFHKGDFVENKDGRVGYISFICHCDKCKERGFYEPTIKYTNGTEDYISDCSVNNIPLEYKRIGSYEFEEKNKSKSKYMKKSISWYALWKRIGKQPIHKTLSTKVQVLINGELKECALVFTNNGRDFHLEPVRSVNDDRTRNA